MRTGRKHLRQYGSFLAGLGQLKCRTQAGTTATNDNGVVRQGTHVRHESGSPQNLDAPDQEHKHGQDDDELGAETHAGGLQIVGSNRPQADPGMSSQRDESQKRENPHPGLGKQVAPGHIVEPGVKQQIRDDEYSVKSQDDGTDTLNDPVGDAATPQISDIGYHTQTPARMIRTALMTTTACAFLTPPSRVTL